MTRRVAARGSGAGMGGGGHANNPAFMFGADYAKNKWKPALFVGTCTAVVQHGQKCPLGSAPNAAPAASLGCPSWHRAARPSRRGRGRATGRPASAVRARVVSAASGVNFMAFHPAARRRHPVLVGEVRAEEGRRRVVSSCFPAPRRPGRVGGEAPQYILRCGEPPSMMDATILHREAERNRRGSY